MKKISLLCCFFYNFCYGCNITADTTPIKYKNLTTISRDIYKTHKLVLADNIKILINNKEEPYYSKENDSLTEIFIDTILYSPQKDKIAFFVITKNSNDKLLGGGDKNKYHYDAHCFTGNLNKSFYIENLKWLRVYNLSRYPNFKKARNRIREIHFKEFAGRGSSKLKYNLDDIRFWESSVW